MDDARAVGLGQSVGDLDRVAQRLRRMVTEEGRIKIVDFGLAKLVEPAESSPDAATLSARPSTQEGTVLGTAAYMSPEQAEGRKLDGRSDIFSFGLVLYEMVTSRKPFTGDSLLAVLTKILNEEPAPPSQLAAAIPPELEKIILRCLRKDPARRWQTMADLKVALEDVAAESASGPQARRAPSWRRWVWAALLPVLLVAGFFAWRAWRALESTERSGPSRSPPLPARSSIPRFPLTATT